MLSEMQSFFVRDGDIFFGQDPARGPWSIGHCHAGPVAGLMARAAEHAISTDKELVRLTVDLLRPVPLNGVRLDAVVQRNGRRVATTAVTLTDLDGRVCATGSSMHLAREDLGDMPTADGRKLDFTKAIPGAFPVQEVHHDRPSFANFVEIAYPPGEDGTTGPTTLWMKTLPLLPDEPTSPFQRLCPIADCGNGTSRNGELSDYQFVNTDLTVTAYRRPVSNWLASDSVSHWDGTGIGLTRAVLYDTEGVVGVALQTLVLGRAS